MKIMRCLWAIAFFMSPSVFATTFLMMSEEDKMRTASAICAVEVLSIVSEEVNSQIRTRATVKPLECFKNGQTTNFDVIWPGGKLPAKDGKPARISMVPDTPKFQVGDKSLIYLWRRQPSDLYTVHSWIHGSHPLIWDTSAKEFRLQGTRASGVSKKSKATSSRRSSSIKAQETKGPLLSEFRSKVNRTLNASSRP